MALAPHTIDDITAYESINGHPGEPLPRSIREAYEAARMPLPELTRGMLAIHTPPLPGARSGVGGCCYDTPEPHGGHCHVCGKPTRKDQNLAAGAVAAFEDAVHPQTHDPLRLLVTHCDEHGSRRHDSCRRDAVTPGSGYRNDQNIAAGFCEPLSREDTIGISFFPYARQLPRFLKYALASMGIAVPAWAIAQLAVATSQGQQVANFNGPLTKLYIPGDSTAGHGYNAGLLRILSGTAPSTAPAANQAETGTLLISWTMPNPAFTGSVISNAETATAAAISNVNASATNTAGYGRLVEQADTFGLSTAFCRLQFAVGTSGSDMNFNTLSITSGGACSCTSLVLIHGT